MKTTKLFQMLLLLGAFLIAGAMTDAKATDLNSYQVRETYEFWSPFNDGYSLGSNRPWGRINIPQDFAFNYDNQNITTVTIYGDGWLSFNADRNPSQAPGFAGYPNMVSWYGNDLRTLGDLSYKFVGTKPFRSLIIQHLKAQTMLDGTKNYFDAQVIIYETTNEITVIYGENSGIGRQGIDGAIYFVGSSQSKYINVRPEDEFTGSTYYKNNNSSFWLNKNTRDWVFSGRAWTLSPAPSVATVYPAPGDILVTGKIYEGDERPFVRINRAATQEQVTFTYNIYGPLSSANPKIIYQGQSDEYASSTSIDPNPQPEGNANKVMIDHANQLCGDLQTGALDLLTNKDIIVGGQYQVRVRLTQKTSGLYSDYTSTFTIALQNDLEVTSIIYPVTKNKSIYPYNKRVPIEIKTRNLGKRAITKFEMTAVIEHISTKSKTTLKYNFDSSIPPNNPIEMGESFVVDNFDLGFIPDKIGDYKITVTTKILDAASDDDPLNNQYPRKGQADYVFEVGYDYEGEVVGLVGADLDNGEYVNSPVSVGVELRNNGSIDLAGDFVYVEIIDPDGVSVYNEKTMVSNLPTRFDNQKPFYLDKPFFPKKSGDYTVKVNYAVDGDVIPSNNKKTYILTVNGGLKGKYTIAKSGADFASLGDAVNALYRRGVAGPVTFYLTDLFYSEGDINKNGPAIDLSSKIIGVSKANPVIFTVREDDFGQKIQVHLYSKKGIGILFGQNAQPDNVKAPVYYVDLTQKNEFARSEGYITFDGLASHSLKFVLHTLSAAKAVVNLATGSQNITFKNTVLVDNSKSSNCDIPGARFNSGSQKFEFKPFANSSAGVLLRNLPPVDLQYGINYYNIDTLIIKNNVIDNNEIHGFGVGVISLGIGALLDANTGDFATYYNENNTISNNIIYDVSKTGIFVGYENGTNIDGNRIFQVTGSCVPYAAGIMAGGEADNINNYYGFNNLNLTIQKNEISDVSGLESVYGIVSVQTPTTIQFTGKSITIPSVDENTLIKNNIVWNLKPAEDIAAVVGISISTDLNDATNKPMVADYFTNGDIIANNTIYIEDYNNVVNKALVVGISMSYSNNPQFYNNAIAITDNTISSSSVFNTAVLYQGLLPRWGQGLVSDRNAFYLTNPTTDLFRLIQIRNDGSTVNAGKKGEFLKLSQWQYWTGQDGNSISGNFIKDFVIKHSKGPNDDDDVLDVLTLRVNDTPYPKNSVLNNRGMNLEKLVYDDVDGIVRGKSGERFDIGAVEFYGSSYISDLELVRLIEPGVYKDQVGKFSAYEYIMTEAPVPMTVAIRNNSSMSTTSPSVHVTIYHETYAGVFDPSLNKVMDYTLQVPSIGSFQTAVVSLTNKNNEFVPETYGDWRRTDGTQPFNVPDEFKAMEPNVSPLYKIIIELGDDENGYNNKIEKIVRFYLKRATLSLMVSAENMKYDISNESDPNLFASRLNLDSVVKVLNNFGWSTKLGPEPENNHLDVDLFDRKEWEPRSINYPLYRTLIWSDGDDKTLGVANTLSSFDVINLEDYFKSGSASIKKNFIASSQEFIRANEANNKEFMNYRIRATVNQPGNPLDLAGNYSGDSVTGISLAKDLIFGVQATQWLGDSYPQPGLNKIITDSKVIGTSKIAIKYNKHYQDRPDKGKYVALEERIGGVITSALPYNIIVLNVDWRHWSSPETVMRAVLDYLEKNGIVVPVELYDFNATSTSNGVQLDWATQSEMNSAYFDIEKANVIDGSTSNFTAFEKVPANGASTTIKYYGPYVDNKVVSGNSYAYRLKLVDADGNYTYSEVKIVNVQGETGAAYINSLNPNPVTETSEVQFTISNEMNISAMVYDLSGKVVATLFNGTKPAGTHSLSIDAHNFASGSYTIVIKAGDNMLTQGMNVVK
ncbi:MAG: T9SS type A sorting domain-containing protein [bacterium]